MRATVRDQINGAIVLSAQKDAAAPFGPALAQRTDLRETRTKRIAARPQDLTAKLLQNRNEFIAQKPARAT